jgi:hypothetical protein
MSRHGFRLLLFPLALLCCAGQPAGWDKVAALPPGTQVQVLLRNEKFLNGALSGVTAEGLTVARKRDSIQVARSEVRRVWTTRKGSRLKNAGLAALVGFGVGCPIGWASAGYISDMNNPPLNTNLAGCAVLGGLGAGIAAGVTAAVPATRRTLVFRTP